MPNPNDKRDDTMAKQAMKSGAAVAAAKAVGGDGVAKLLGGAMVAGDLVKGNVVCVNVPALSKEQS